MLDQLNVMKILWPYYLLFYKNDWLKNNSFDIKSTFTWDPKWTQTGLKSQTALKYRSVYMAIYMEIWLQQLSKQ